MITICKECGIPNNVHPCNWCLPHQGPAPHVKESLQYALIHGPKKAKR